MYKFNFISEEDSGIYNAMNKGYKIAKGKYIWYINSDDAAEFKAIDYILNEINNQKVDSDFLHGNMASMLYL